MIDNKTRFPMRWNGANRRHYEERGYTFTKYGDEFLITAADLTAGSNCRAPFICDVCGARGWRAYSALLQRPKHSCGDKRCRAELSRLTNLERYGVERPLQSSVIMAKAKATCREHFGVDFSGQAPNVVAKRRATNLERYGVEHPLQNPELMAKARDTWRRNLGVDHPFKAESVKAKSRATTRERLGVDHAMQAESVKAKSKATCEERYGGGTCMSSPTVRAKQQRTLMERLGVDNPMKSAEVREQVKATNRERRGVDWVTQDEATKEKMRATMVEQYGVEHALRSDELCERAQATCREHFGVDHPLQSGEVRAKAQATLREHFGVDTPMHSPEVRAKVLRTMFADGTGPSSRAQRHLCAVLGGELNYPLGSLMIDCALVDQRIAVEYDGSGHDLCVRMGTKTPAQFASAERRRDHVLRSAGWRLVRLASSRDELPADDQLRALMHRVTAEWLSGRSWVRVDLDTGAVTGHDLAERLDLDALRLFRPHRKADE